MDELENLIDKVDELTSIDNNRDEVIEEVREEPKPKAKKEETVKFKNYIVGKGDSIMGIAAKMCGDYRRAHEIREINGISSVFEGQTIKLPKA